MTIRNHRWTIIQATESESVLKEQLAKEINVPDTLARVLCNRGITTYAKAKEFFRPQLSDLHDPFLMDGMDKAVARTIRAVESKERIMVFGDYDVDGTTSAAMLTLFFRDLGAETSFCIPDRIKEGYGVSRLAIDKAKENGINLLVAVDCGITALDQIDYAQSLGIDVIVCDHHEPLEKLPNAVAVLDPLKPGCLYPFKYLCGCGVGFKFIQGISSRLKRESEETFANKYIDFVAIATSADIVPMVGENRIFTKIGLQQINLKPRAGIRALIENSGLQPGRINTGQIVFVLAPRINAVGRMGDASRAVQLLMSEDATITQQLAQVLEEENKNRRKIDEDTFLQAQQLVESYLDADSDPAIVLHQETWHPGVIGIVASRLVEKYYRPTIMMTTVDGVAKGSARSISGFDIHAALKRVEDKLLQFGGHKYAAGLAVALDRVDEFREAFNLVVEELMTDDIRTPEILIDAEITLSEITPRFLKILKEFAPFGPSNMRPVFLARNVESAGLPRIVGKDHLRFKVRQDRFLVDAIGFMLGSLIDRVRSNEKKLDIVFSIDEYEWRSNQSPPPAQNSDSFLQLKVRDIRTNEEGN